MEALSNCELRILDWIAGHLGCGFFDFLMPALGVVGNGVLWVSLGVLLFLLPKYRKNGFVMLLSLLTGILIGNLLLKFTVARPRPCWLNPDFPLLVKVPKDYSFPSCHAQAATISAFNMTKANKKFGFVMIPLAILIAFSRMYCYLHFLTDVIAGALVGFTISLLYNLFLLPKAEKFFDAHPITIKDIIRKAKKNAEK